MCGQFTNRYTWRQLKELYDLTIPLPASNFPPRYNIAPTQQAFVIRLRDGHRVLAEIRWGLVPFWLREAKGGERMINAPSETADVKPAFRNAWKARRCLVVGDGFYEWPEKDKPRFITLKDGAPFAFAGLWESWGRKAGDELETFTILTATPNEHMAGLYHRMPVMLSPESWATWLGEAPGDLKSLCRPFAS